MKYPYTPNISQQLLDSYDLRTGRRTRTTAAARQAAADAWFRIGCGLLCLVAGSVLVAYVSSL